MENEVKICSPAKIDCITKVIGKSLLSRILNVGGCKNYLQRIFFYKYTGR